MISYATVTGTKRNIAAIRDHRWGWLFSAAGWLPTHSWLADQGIEECCGDSGAWHFHQNGIPFDETKYLRFLDWIAALKPRFVMLPDIVGEGARSLDLSLKWMPELDSRGLPMAIVVQDGMQDGELLQRFLPLVGPKLAICVGGTTEWKLWSLKLWCAAARTQGAWSHILRVNTGRRIRLCDQAGADSYDGTSGSIWGDTVPMLDRERRTQDIEGFIARNPE